MKKNNNAIRISFQKLYFHKKEETDKNKFLPRVPRQETDPHSITKTGFKIKYVYQFRHSSGLPFSKNWKRKQMYYFELLK